MALPVQRKNQRRSSSWRKTARRNPARFLEESHAGDSTKLLQAAQSEKDPELRRAAIRNLGLVHSNDSAKALQAIYAKETDREVREEVLNAFFLQGNASALVAIARSEKDPELK